MSQEYTVGQYLVDRLREVGLKHLFSVAGDYSINWVSDYVERSGIKVIQPENELIGGYAADGYARLKGIGALCVTYSAGALSAANAIAGAYVERVPVVLINGTPSIKDTLTFEQTGFSVHHFISGRDTNLKVFEPITTASVRIDNPDLAPMLIDAALTQCITERRPVYIELLEDVVDLSCQRPQSHLKRARLISLSDDRKQSIEIIKEELQKAVSPLLWVGVEVDRFDLHDKAETLIGQLNIPYTTELLSKAILSEDDPLFAGVFDGRASSGPVQELVKQSDFILALGVWLTDINSLGWSFEKTNIAYVSFDTVKYGGYFSAQVSLEDFIDDLCDSKVTGKARALPQGSSFEQCGANLDDKITYQGFYDVIPKYIDKNTIICSDASLNYFGSLLLKVGAPRGYIAQSSYSSIGYAAPAATGVCLAKKPDQRVIVFSGDGGFQMTPQCLSTQNLWGLDPIIFVIDNGVYAVEQWLHDASVFHTDKAFSKQCELRRWNYSKLPEAFGGHERQGWKVTTYGELDEAVNGAIENRSSPSVIQVVVPRNSIPRNAEWKTR